MIIHSLLVPCISLSFGFCVLPFLISNASSYHGGRNDGMNYHTTSYTAFLHSGFMMASSSGSAASTRTTSWFSLAADGNGLRNRRRTASSSSTVSSSSIPCSIPMLSRLNRVYWSPKPQEEDIRTAPHHYDEDDPSCTSSLQLKNESLLLYHPTAGSKTSTSTCRRTFGMSLVVHASLVGQWTMISGFGPAASYSHAAAATFASDNKSTKKPTMDRIALIVALQDISRLLQQLLNNWNSIVIDCNYADVPRELLETKNKELLLEKAKVSALFDKSVSVITCKTSNRLLRAYIQRIQQGGTQSNGIPLTKLIQKGFESISNDDDSTSSSSSVVEEYVQAIELLQQALNRADSFAYTSGASDLSSVNNFSPTEQNSVFQPNTSLFSTNLDQSRFAIEQANQQINRMIHLLDTTND